MTSEFIHLGPKVLKTKISDSMLLELREHVNALLTGPHSDYSSDLAGKNTHQCVLEYEVVTKTGLDEFILNAGHDYLNQHNSRERLNIMSAWVNVCKYSDYNPIHEHNGLFSGVLYIDCPQSTIDSSNQRVPLTDGHTQFIFGQELRFSNAVLTVYPEPGTLLLFPSWLMHVAYPSRSELNRTTISFNLGI
jgi:uncharacterized protein (TIGR02466 family)